MVRLPMFRRVLDLFQVGQPTVDIFAKPGESQVPRFRGPGGEVQDAFTESWRGVGLLWANPPYSRLDECVQKILLDKPTMVLVVPDWPWSTWWRDLQPTVSRSCFFPKASAVFQLHGRKSQPTRWGVWAYLIDPQGTYGRPEVNEGTTQEARPVEVEPEVVPPHPSPYTRLRNRSEFDPDRHLKILTWNVNGLQAMYRRRWLRDLYDNEQPDIVCLQEVKLQAKNQRKVAKYGRYLMFTHCCTTQKGYSGTRTYIRPQLAKSVMYGPKDGVEDEGRLLTVGWTCYVVNVYVPIYGIKLNRVQYRTESWDPRLRNFLTRLQESKPVIVAGDMNVAHKDIDRFPVKPRTEMEKEGVAVRWSEPISIGCC